MTYATHKMDVYDVELQLATTPKSWKKARKRFSYLAKNIPTAAGTTHFAVWEPADGGVPTPVVTFWIRDALNGDASELINTCAHEATHAATHILTWMGHHIGCDDARDEPTAYLIGWLTAWLYDHARRDDPAIEAADEKPTRS